MVASLDRGHFTSLHRARMRHGADRLGDEASKDFALLHVFDIAPALIRQPTDLLRVLLRRHHQNQRLPRILEDRLIHLLRRSGGFESWPLETIVPDRDAFFSFLQERWPLFLDRLAENTDGGPWAGSGPVSLELEGPADLPFDHDDVRIYIDNLFFEGMLSAVPHEADDALRDEWVAVGIRYDPEADKARRVEGLMGAVGASIPGPDARHREWTAFAYRWAELCALRLETAAPAGSEGDVRMSELQMEVDRTFLAWTERRYAGLHNQPPDPPVMVHHVARYVARRIEHGSNRKAALIVVDGLALNQWIVLRDVLANQRPCLRFREGTVFAWVPTITSVSRQAIFAGKPPLYFPASILGTDREPSSWKQFWEDQGVPARAVDYAKGLGDGPLDRIDEILSRTDVRVLGLVVDKVDKIMHGMELDIRGHAQPGSAVGRRRVHGGACWIFLLDDGFDGIPDLRPRQYRGGGRWTTVRRRGCRRSGRASADLSRRGVALSRAGTVPGRRSHGPQTGSLKIAWLCSLPPARRSFGRENASSGTVAFPSKKSSSRGFGSNGRRAMKRRGPDRFQPVYPPRLAGIHRESRSRREPARRSHRGTE